VVNDCVPLEILIASFYEDQRYHVSRTDVLALLELNLCAIGLPTLFKMHIETFFPVCYLVFP
jgi:hypothetical protein